MMRLLTTIALGVAALVFAAGLAFTWCDLARTTALRPLDYAEAEVLFDAARIREARALYFDVVAGASYGGGVPSRHFVVYVPTHAWILAHLPLGSWGMAAAGRALSVLAWIGAAAWIVVGGRAREKRIALGYALLVLGTWGLAIYATYARPDAVALLAIGIAFAQSVRRGRIGAAWGALFALGVWIKPNFVGLLAGAMIAEVIVHRARSWRAIAGAAAASAPIAIALQITSGGAWLRHLLASAAQPLAMHLWIDGIEHYLPFYGFPLAFAAFCAWRAREERGMLHAFAGLVASTAWTLLAIGKIGAAGNYWMEPCLGALAVMANAPLPALSDRARLGLALGAAAQAFWIGVADIRTSLDEQIAIPRRAAFLEHVRARCSAPSRLVLSDSTGAEMALDGRILFSPMQLRELVTKGRFPVDAWIATVEEPEIACVLFHTDPPATPAPITDSESFPPAVLASLAHHFTFAEAAEDMRLYVRTQ
jgi:hypothetical protein